MNKKRENMIVVSEGNDKIEEVEYNERQQQLLTRSEPFCLNFKSSSKAVDDKFLMSEVSYDWTERCQLQHTITQQYSALELTHTVVQCFRTHSHSGTVL